MQWALRDVLEVALPRGALFRDRSSIEELVDDIRDFEFGVEPFDEFDSFVAAGDAKVEFVPEVRWEVCDFTVPVFILFVRSSVLFG